MSLFKEIEQKPLEYLILLFIFIGAVIAYLTFGFDRQEQRWVIYATCGAYFLWMLYHHYRRGDLHLSIIIEYLAFILLAIVITASTLL